MPPDPPSNSRLWRSASLPPHTQISNHVYTSIYEHIRTGGIMVYCICVYIDAIHRHILYLPTFLNPQVWDSHLRRESWQVYNILLMGICVHLERAREFESRSDRRQKGSSCNKGVNTMDVIVIFEVAHDQLKFGMLILLMCSNVLVFVRFFFNQCRKFLDMSLWESYMVMAKCDSLKPSSHTFSLMRACHFHSDSIQAIGNSVISNSLLSPLSSN